MNLQSSCIVESADHSFRVLAPGDYLLRTSTDSRWPPYVVARIRLPKSFEQMLRLAATYRKIGPTLHSGFQNVVFDGSGLVRFFETQDPRLSDISFSVMKERYFESVECVFNGTELFFRGFSNDGFYVQTLVGLPLSDITFLLSD